MKTQDAFSTTTNPNTITGRLRTGCAARLLPILLLLLALPAVVQAQFTFTTNNNGSLNIVSYNGSDGAVTIPDKTNGLSVTSIGGLRVQRLHQPDQRHNPRQRHEHRGWSIR
jgi:hypothetical protein